MSIHTVAYYESVTTAGTLQAITPVSDPTVTINSNAIQVPANYNKVTRVGSVTGSNQGTQVELQSPSLRELYFPDLFVGNLSTTFDNPFDFADLDMSPLQLITNEGLEYYSDAGGDGSTAQAVYGIVFFTDAPIVKATGKERTIRGTLAASASASAWASSQITFGQTIPVGNYDVVGMRVEGAGLVAARLVFVGPSGITRPGCLGNSDANAIGQPAFRHGNFGVLGTFNSTTPPSVEVLGGSTSAQVIYLDLIKRG